MNDAGYRSLAEDSPIRASIAAAIPGKKTAPADDLANFAPGQLKGGQ